MILVGLVIIHLVYAITKNKGHKPKVFDCNRLHSKTNFKTCTKNERKN
jgi:hypothetical protein